MFRSCYLHAWILCLCQYSVPLAFIYTICERFTTTAFWHPKRCSVVEQGVVTYMSPIEAFATSFLIGKKCAWLFDCSLLKQLVPRVKGCSHMFLIVDFSSSEVTLIPRSALQKGFDRLIQFSSWWQMLLHEIYVTNEIWRMKLVLVSKSTVNLLTLHLRLVLAYSYMPLTHRISISVHALTPKLIPAQADEWP